MRECIVPGCEAEIRSDYWICKRCFGKFGYYSKWPDWLKSLLVVEQRLRRADFRSGRDGVSHIEYNDECVEGSYPPTLAVICTREQFDKETGLPLYPYPADEQNEIYQDANGILSQIEKREARYKENRNLWRSINGDRANKAAREWQNRNREYCLEKSNEYSRNHPEIGRRAYRKRRARESSVECTLTKEQEIEILSWGCLACGTHENLTIAHDVAVSNGGPTTWENCFCLCQSHNSQQYTKSLLEWRPDLVSKLMDIRAKTEYPGAASAENNIKDSGIYATAATSTME